MISSNSKTIVETKMFLLFDNNKDIFAIRKNDRALSENLNENSSIAEMIEYLNEYSTDEINEVLNEITYKEDE